MNDYNKDYFWTSIDSDTGIKRYYFRINGMMVEVPKEVYNVCFNSYAKMLRDSKRDKDVKLMSIDNVNQDGHALADVIAVSCDVENEVLQNLMVEIMRLEISKLSNQEKKLLLALLKEKSVNQLSIEWGIPYMTLKRRKDRIMKKLKEKLEK